MSLKNRLLKLLKSKKGNALLLATAGAIAATFSVYFFVSITTLSADSKQRVAHLYNAYQMGQSLKAKIDGADINESRLGAGTEADVEAPIDEVFHNGKFITLKQMVKKAIIIASKDPTATERSGTDTGYDITNSGVLIKYADAAGAVIAATDSPDDATDTVVADVHLFVNLAGTPDVEFDNSPYSLNEPFYYILMDNTVGVVLADSLLTISSSQYPAGILETKDGGPQAEVSVILPQDAEE